MCAEDILRTTKEVSCEKGSFYGERGTVCITASNEVRVKERPIPPRVKIETQPPYSRRKMPDEESKQERLWYTCTSLLDKPEDEDYPFEVRIANDMHSKDPIDNRLAKIWKANVSEDQYYNERIRTQLKAVRYFEIRAQKAVSTTIRMLYNDIYWEYGDVVVSRGDNNDKIIKDRLSAYADTYEAFQNDGKFPVLDLSDARAFVLGPQKILEKYRDQPQYSVFNMIYIEELSVEEVNFFRVPKKLLGVDKLKKEAAQYTHANNDSVTFFSSASRVEIIVDDNKKTAGSSIVSISK